jgi:hypothetical protein
MHFASPAAQLSSQLHDLPLYTCAMNTWFPLDLRLGENLSQYLSFAQEKNLFSCWKRISFPVSFPVYFMKKHGILYQCW